MVLRGKELSRNKTFLWNNTDESSDESLQEKRKRLAYTIHLGGICIYRLGLS